MKISTAVVISVCLGLCAVPAVFAAPQQAARPDLNGTLAELQRISSATTSDIGNLRIDKWGAGWKIWKGRGGQKKEDMEHVAATLQKNLTDAIPSLSKEVQAAHGTISTTFKLYRDVDVVYNYLGRLSEAAEANGKKEEYGPLADDVAALETVRAKLSAYIEQASASLESTGKLPAMAATAAPASRGPLPKKIIVDDPAAAKKTSKKP
jgi:hypothetical protein